MFSKSFMRGMILASPILDVVSSLPYNTSDSSNSTLKWAPCDLDFPSETADKIAGPIDCATLEVPLDHNLRSGKTFPLQLIRQPATKEPVKGTIIFNPGGPGRSGVQEVAEMGHVYRDEAFNGQYHVLGFDARGTGRTMPFICDPTKGSNVTSNFTSNAHGIKNDDTTFASLDMWEFLRTKAWDDATWYVSSCANTEGNDDIGRYLGTTFVARDMLKIVDALNEDGLLHFWGRSYSTTLGQTFAAMFPDRVGRMLLDSVMRASDYWDGSMLTATLGTEKSLENWLDNCISAGPELCPGIANFTGPDTTVQNVMDALAEVFQELEDDPVMLPEGYLGYSSFFYLRPNNLSLLYEAKFRILSSLYRPDQVPILSFMLTTLLARDWDAWFATDDALPPEEETELPWQYAINNIHGIACADSTFRAKNPEDLYSIMQAQSKQGSFADVLSPQYWLCSQWPWKSAEQFEGSFKNVNTSYPILFVNSAFDPITPLDPAWEAASGFQGSRLLTHKGHGHGFMNHPSACTISTVRDYFFDGVLPEHGNECEPDQGLFEYAATVIKEQGQGEENGE